MADYFSILKKTIDGLPNNTPQVREAVYKKARAAIEAQLRGMSPTPSEEAISSQLGLLEEAIVVVDAEYSAPQAASSAETTQTPSVPEPEPAASPVTPTAEVTPETAVSVGAPAPEVSAAVPSAPETITQIPADPVASAPDPVVGESSAASNVPPVEEEKSGCFGKLIWLLVVVGILGGAGYGIWTNKDTLQPMLSQLISGGSSQPSEDDDSNSEIIDNGSESEKAIDEDTGAQVEKDPVKLNSDGNEVSGSTEPKPEPEPEVVVEPEETPVVIDNEDDGSAASDIVKPEPVQEVVDDATEDSTTVTQDNSTLPVGEVAYLYEEGTAGSGASRTNAAIVWSLKRQSIAEGLAPEQVIVGTMDVPDKDLSMNVEIKRNVDSALPASHIIELRFRIPDGFSGGGIDNISRFVMKATEEARGEPLVAVPAKVSDGFFLIALDNLQQAVDVNTQLLLESLWIDIPVSYSTGKRALVTLEKGGTGEQVFREAFKDWSNR